MESGEILDHRCGAFSLLERIVFYVLSSVVAYPFSLVNYFVNFYLLTPLLIVGRIAQ